MKTVIIGSALAVSLFLSVSATAQTANRRNTTLQLGERAIVIPAPAGFEEAASQFETIKERMTATEDPGNDMLAVHLPTEDCERLRRGEVGPFNFYTKISVRKAARGRDYSEAEFAAIAAEFQKNGAKSLDLNSPGLKASVAHAEQAVKELNRNQATVELGQPVNLGEFENRPNLYSAMLLMNITVQRGDTRQVTPLLAGLSFVRVKQRLIFVYTYRKYESQRDIELLRDFTKRWADAILAAN